MAVNVSELKCARNKATSIMLMKYIEILKSYNEILR